MIKVQYKRVHCVGIGGIGVSALAQLLMKQGVTVTGSDAHETIATKRLVKQNVPITIGPYKARSLPSNVDLVVYTSDEWPDNPELKRAVQRKIPVKSYPQAIPIVLAGKKIIGIAGTHGKTTTTSMLGSVLIDGGQDPSILVGSMLAKINGNARQGSGPYAVVEADEYRRAFLNYPVDIPVITNIEADHLNYYRDLEDIKSAFRKFITNAEHSGIVIANGDDPVTRQLTEKLDCCTLWYGLDKHNDLQAKSLNLKGELTSFRAIQNGRAIGDFRLRVPGLHNISNALATIAAALRVGVTPKAIQEALEQFPGTWRRFEYKGEKNGITVIDDYAHHPTELTATLKAARDRFGKRKLVVIFQPHFYGRLKDFFKEFVESLKLADRVIIPPVHYVEGRENATSIMRTYNSETLAKAVGRAGTPAVPTPDILSALPIVAAEKKTGDVIMTIGAGKVTELSDKIVEIL